MKDEKKVYKKTDIGLNCPKCGQFMGPVSLCPYCRTRVKNRLDIKTFKAISLLVAIIGIALLLVWANVKPHNEMDIGDITKRQNYAYLRINGTVIDDARYYVTLSDSGKVLPGSISFQIDDGTGILQIKAYQEVTKDLVKDKKIPVKGDKVVVEGPVMFRGDEKSLVIQSVNGLKIEDEKPVDITMAEINGTGEDGYLFSLGPDYKRYLENGTVNNTLKRRLKTTAKCFPKEQPFRK